MLSWNALSTSQSSVASENWMVPGMDTGWLSCETTWMGSASAPSPPRKSYTRCDSG